MSFPQEQLLKENIMKLSSTAIKELSSQYRSVLQVLQLLQKEFPEHWTAIW